MFYYIRQETWGAETGKRMHSEMGFIRVPKEQLGQHTFALAVTQSSGNSFGIILIVISSQYCNRAFRPNIFLRNRICWFRI